MFLALNKQFIIIFKLFSFKSKLFSKSKLEQFSF
jgi:hypothetical protein